MTETVGLPSGELLTPGEVAKLFRVDPKTVTRWAKAGKLPAIRTLGGHRRFRAEDVRRILEGEERPSSQGHTALTVVLKT